MKTTKQEYEEMPLLDSDPAKVCTLEECPPGLFFHSGTLGLKTEYRDENGPEAYVAESGEYFWGGTADPAARRKLVVIPAFLTAAPEPNDDGVWE